MATITRYGIIFGRISNGFKHHERKWGIATPKDGNAWSFPTSAPLLSFARSVPDPHTIANRATAAVQNSGATFQSPHRGSAVPNAFDTRE